MDSQGIYYFLYFSHLSTIKKIIIRTTISVVLPKYLCSTKFYSKQSMKELYVVEVKVEVSSLQKKNLVKVCATSQHTLTPQKYSLIEHAVKGKKEDKTNL